MTKREKRILIAKAIKVAVYSPLFLGAFTLLGSLGALDIGRTQYAQICVQCAIGIFLMGLSAYAHYKIYEEVIEDEYC